LKSRRRVEGSTVDNDALLELSSHVSMAWMLSIPVGYSQFHDQDGIEFISTIPAGMRCLVCPRGILSTSRGDTDRRADFVFGRESPSVYLFMYTQH
jgi:hypothetical protein